MTIDQGLAISLVVGVIALLVWGRLRYDVVAALALLAGVAIGIVPAGRAFTGFGDEIVVTVASALVVSAGLGRSGVVEWAIRPIRPLLRSQTTQVLVLTALVTAASGFIKNIAALAMLLPVASQVARRSGHSPAYLLMPLSFGSLLGGLVTLIGTSPNIIVSRMRAEILGQPFRMFDFAPVGAGLAIAGVLFLAVGWRLLPRSRTGTLAPDAQFSIEDYTFELRVPVQSPTVNQTVAQLERKADGEITVVAIIREGFRRYVPAGHWWIFADDILVVQGDAAAIHKLLHTTGLELANEVLPHPAETGARDVTVAEVVVAPGSPLIGNSVEQFGLRDRFRVNLLAVSRRGARLRQRLRRIRIQPGDLIVLQGAAETMPETLQALGCLPLAERRIPLGKPQRILLPTVIVAVAVALVSVQIVPVSVGFFGAAVAMVLAGALTLDDAYRAVDWPVILLLGALIPVSESLRATGATDLIAGWLASGAGGLPTLWALGLTMFAAMAITPFLNNAATVLVMAPIGAGLAARLGLSPDPFLMAVAVGAACDFLTPIGHQCNTLVMGPGGYRFGDYWKLGLPLSLIVLGLGTLLIAWVWPLR
ncbi:MAG TPA: SLC13 family permease [Azospirillaceae bacterium]|nr:SLC13 family permease [Azospirillaceae bacterium]